MIKPSVKAFLFLFIYFFTFYNSSYSQSYFSDDFESGLSKWSVSGLDWDTTAELSRSGKYSITESPNGNYKAGANVSIISAQTINLDSAKQAVLTFWHRYNTEYSAEQGIDFCRVEISTNSGFSWKEIKKYSGNQNSWTYEQLNLKKFSGKTIKLRFRLTDIYANWNGNNQQDGWYIDDVEIKELETKPSISLPFKDDFENETNNLLLSNQDWGITSEFYHSGKHSITDSPNGNYPSHANSILTLTGIINLTNLKVPIITFWQKYTLSGEKDYCLVEISTDFGFTWNEIKKYSGVQNTWVNETIDLRNYINNSIKVRFRLLGSQRATDDGWYIDDLEIKESGY